MIAAITVMSLRYDAGKRKRERSTLGFSSFNFATDLAIVLIKKINFIWFKAIYKRSHSEDHLPVRLSAVLETTKLARNASEIPVLYSVCCVGSKRRIANFWEKERETDFSHIRCDAAHHISRIRAC